MSWQGGWKRRGPWLEVTPGREITEGEYRTDAVDHWLLNRLELPDKLWRRLRHEKQIELAGDRLRLALFPVTNLGVIPRWYDLKVLYEDDFCLVAHKPAGMAVHPDGAVKDGPLTLDHAVASYYEMNGIHTAVRHVHRLDTDTTGPVLYAKNEFALLKLDEQMRAKDIGRRYVALVRGKSLHHCERWIGRLARTGITSSVAVFLRPVRARLPMWNLVKYGGAVKRR